MTFHAPIEPEKKAAIVEKACEHVASGKSLRSFCDQEGLPFSSVYLWCREETVDGQSALAYAIDIGTHSIAHECLDEARSITDTNYAGKKARIDALLRLAGKWNKRDYGDQQNIALEVSQKPDLSGLSDGALQEFIELRKQQLPGPKG